MLEEQGIVLKTARESFVVVTRDGRFLAVRKTSEAQIGEEIRFFQRDILEPGQPSSKTRSHRMRAVLRALSYAAAACLFISVGLISLPWIQKPTHTLDTVRSVKKIHEVPAAFVTVDINPSIELALNKADRVISGKGLNEDGQRVLNDAKVEGRTLMAALSKISDSAFRLGYIKTDSENQMLVTATSVSDASDATKKRLAQDLDVAREEAIKAVKESAPQVQLKVAAVTVPKDVREKANKIHLSVGKYIVLDTAKSNGIRLTADQIRQASLRNVIKTTGFDINMIVREYGYHDRSAYDSYMAGAVDGQREVDPVRVASSGIQGNAGRTGVPASGKPALVKAGSARTEPQQLRKGNIKVSYESPKSWKMRPQTPESDESYENRNPIAAPTPEDGPQKPIIVGVNIGQGGIEITSSIGALTKSLSTSEPNGAVAAQTQGQSAGSGGTVAPDVSTSAAQQAQATQTGQNAGAAGQYAGQQTQQLIQEVKSVAVTATQAQTQLQTQSQSQGQQQSQGQAAAPSGTVIYAKPQTGGWGARWSHQSQPQPDVTAK